MGFEFKSTENASNVIESERAICQYIELGQQFLSETKNEKLINESVIETNKFLYISEKDQSDELRYSFYPVFSIDAQYFFVLENGSCYNIVFSNKQTSISCLPLQNDQNFFLDENISKIELKKSKRRQQYSKGIKIYKTSMGIAETGVLHIAAITVAPEAVYTLDTRNLVNKANVCFKERLDSKYLTTD